MNETEIYKIQISRLIDTLEETSSQYGLKKAVFEVLGTVNHKVRKYYERRQYVAHLTGGYTSTNSLKQVLHVNPEYQELLKVIASSDLANRQNKVHFKVILKRSLLFIMFTIYRLGFWLAKNIYKATKTLLKKARA